jgi:hypothetical protein
MIALFLLLVIVATALGILGVVAKGRCICCSSALSCARRACLRCLADAAKTRQAPGQVNPRSPARKTERNHSVDAPVPAATSATVAAAESIRNTFADSVTIMTAKPTAVILAAHALMLTQFAGTS